MTRAGAGQVAEDSKPAVKLIDLGAAVDLRTGVNFNPETGLLDPKSTSTPPATPTHSPSLPAPSPHCAAPAPVTRLTRAGRGRYAPPEQLVVPQEVRPHSSPPKVDKRKWIVPGPHPPPSHLRSMSTRPARPPPDASHRRTDARPAAAGPARPAPLRPPPPLPLLPPVLTGHVSSLLPY